MKCERLMMASPSRVTKGPYIPISASVSVGMGFTQLRVFENVDSLKVEQWRVTVLREYR